MINVAYTNEKGLTIGVSAKKIMSNGIYVLINFGKKVIYFKPTYDIRTGDKIVRDAVKEGYIEISTMNCCELVETKWREIEREADAVLQSYFKEHEEELLENQQYYDEASIEIIEFAQKCDESFLYHRDFPENNAAILDELFDTNAFSEALSKTVWGMFC